MLVGDTHSGYLNELQLLHEKLSLFQSTKPGIEITFFQDRDAFKGHDEIFNSKCAAGFAQLNVKDDLDVVTCNSAPHAIIGNLENSRLEHA